jgi:hypothetical protein
VTGEHCGKCSHSGYLRVRQILKDVIALPYAITSLARETKAGETVGPSCRGVLRLMTCWNFVG